MYHRSPSTENSQGFTIVELLVAMAFVSMLLLAIATSVIQMSHIYNKGTTMKQVDEAGRTLSDDIRSTLSQSQPFNVDTAFRVQPLLNGGGDGGGRLCTGYYSYIWNYGKALAEGRPVNVYSTDGTDIRFVRVRDSGGQYCADPTKKILQSDATELLSADGAGLAVHSFKITQIADDATIGEALYRIVLELGTDNQDALDQTQILDTLDTTCKPPSDDASLQEFCTVNQFDFTAQAGNKGGN